MSAQGILGGASARGGNLFFIYTCILFLVTASMFVCALDAKGQGDGRIPPLDFEVGGLVLQSTNVVHTGDFPSIQSIGCWTEKKIPLHTPFMLKLGLCDILSQPLLFLPACHSGMLLSTCNGISNFIFLIERRLEVRGCWHLFSSPTVSGLIALQFSWPFPQYH